MSLTKGLKPVRFLDYVCGLYLFFFNSALYGETVVIFAEPRLTNIASFVPCFSIEGGGLRLSAFTDVPVEAACVSEVHGGL